MEIVNSTNLWKFKRAFNEILHSDGSAQYPEYSNPQSMLAAFISILHCDINSTFLLHKHLLIEYMNEWIL